jgi:uncharacterized protein
MKDWVAHEMSILIDGHNLIPKIPGLALRQVNDENDLIELLQTYCRLKQKNAVVYFDGAPAGYDGRKQLGRVTAVFVRQGKTADEAIHQHLQRLGNSARNWQVVSSDRQIVAEAVAARAQVISSSVFAQQIAEAVEQAAVSGGITERKLSEQELSEWYRVFGIESDQEGDNT